MNNLTLRDPRTYQIIGAAMEVHRQLGCGFLETVYQEAFALELRDREIPFRRELLFPVSYKGHCLPCQYRPDFILKVTGLPHRLIIELWRTQLTTTPLRFRLTKRRCF